MSIAQEIRELDSSPTALRKFSWVVGGILVLIAAVGWYNDKTWYPVLLWIGGPLAAIGTVVPRAVKPLYYAWMSMAVVLGFIMTRVILTIFFLLVLTPVGLVFRLLGKDLLNRKIDRQAPTYWLEKKYLIPDRSRYEKFF